MIKNRSQSGQIVLITLLVLTIATTVALSLIVRTTTDTSITAQVEESSRAFSAAEAGIEVSLSSGTGTNGATGIVGAAGVNYSVTVNSIGGATGIYQFPNKTAKGTTETLWLASHNDATGAIDFTLTRYQANTIDVCWSQETTIPAILVTVLYQQSAGLNPYQVVKAAYDPDSTRATTNKFSPIYTAGGCGGNTGTQYKETINFTALNANLIPSTDYLIALMIRPLYSDTTIAINAAGTLPTQGKRIESTGSTTTGTNRKIVVIQQYRSASGIFDAGLYSQGNISH